MVAVFGRGNYSRAVYHICTELPNPDWQLMRATSSMCDWRAAICCFAAILIALCVHTAASVAGGLTETREFAEVGAAVVQYAHKVKPERILLVLDIDNTLLAMDNPLGSDQWFEWQRFLLDNEPKSKYLVADSFAGLLDAQGLLYNLSHMHPPQENLPGLMRRLQALGIRTLVLTSRGPEFRVATERELRCNGYDFKKSAMPVRDIPGGTYMPYDPKHPDKDGLTKEELKKYYLTEPKLISYENGIMMTAGQHKGAMLLTLLHDGRDDIDAVVYDDDNIRHVANVYAAVLARGKEITAFHYTREAPNVKKFDFGSKKDVDHRWRKLSSVLEEVLN
jgi:hypothetical protein